jgi:hypothetical protein
MKLLNLSISVYLSLSRQMTRARERGREFLSRALSRSLALSRGPPSTKSQISVLQGMYDIKYYTQYISEFLPAHHPRLLAFSRHFRFALPLPLPLPSSVHRYNLNPKH